MMANTSATVQIASAVKATLNGFNITRVSQLPTIQSVKILTMELCNMAAAVKSNMTGGIYGHMYLILLQADYRIAINNNRLRSTCYKTPTKQPNDCCTPASDECHAAFSDATARLS
jgi:hypothetical protein